MFIKKMLFFGSGLYKFFTYVYNSKSLSPGGEIGRRRGLKIPRRKACRFDSGPGHHRILEPCIFKQLIFNQLVENTGFFVLPKILDLLYIYTVKLT